MKKTVALLFLLAIQLLSANAFAQPVTQTDADKLFNFAEALDPGLFAPPAATQAANVAGSDWFLRFYANNSLYLAINVNGTGPFMAGDVYALGGPFGDAPVLVGQLASLLAYIDSLTADDDGDGVINTEDQCPDTPSGESVNAQGCGDSELDDDNDGVSNALDVCPDTAAGASVDGLGCAQTQLDDDFDGVNNAIDQCPGTFSGDPVDAEGCSAQQLGIVVLLQDADKLFNFAEQLDAAAFGPPATTQVVNELGNDWYKRTYANSGISVLVNTNGVDVFLAGGVYVSGGPFGPNPVFIDTLANLVAFIDSQVPPDDDNDGVPNDTDQCANTPTGESVNGQGCSASQLDDDNDGVNNPLDQCPATPTGEPVNGNGCSESQLGAGDDDGDGVSNAADLCPATPSGQAVDANGCSASQLDDDDDGVTNDLDQCPATPSGQAVDANGCGQSQLDDDSDGVVNSLDQCPATPSGETVNGSGCSQSQLDDDGDGVPNQTDECPATPSGEAADGSGCGPSQLDEDGDGVNNAADQCPATPFGQSVDANGCSPAQLDDDNDGVNNAADQCPATPFGEVVNASGCSLSQLDDDNDGVSNAADQCPATPLGEAADADGCSASQNNGGGPQYILNQGSGVCAPPVYPPVGLIAKYRTEEEEEDSILEFTEEWLAVSEAEVTTRTSQVFTSQFATSESISTTTQYYDFANGLVFLREMFIEVSDTTTVIGLPIPPEVSEVELSLVFDPYQFLFPQNGYCEGMVLFHPAVTQSTYSNPPLPIDPIVGQTAEFTVNVISVAEQVSVAAGTFNTVHLQEVDLEFEEETTVDVWLDRETGILVKSESRDSGNNLTVITELTEVTYP